MSDQRTDEWIQARLGNVGCSRLIDVCASGKSGAPSATRRNYMTELLVERLTGKRAESFTSEAMTWGIDNEPIARSAYEARYGVMVTEDFGKEHPTVKRWRGSPDGLVDKGGIEIKCTNTTNHLDALLNGNIKRDYILQMAGYVEIYNLDWYDFVSFDPRLPENLSLFVKRFTRDELPLDTTRQAVIQFLKELDEMEKKIRGIK